MDLHCLTGYLQRASLVWCKLCGMLASRCASPMRHASPGYASPVVCYSLYGLQALRCASPTHTHKHTHTYTHTRFLYSICTHTCKHAHAPTYTFIKTTTLTCICTNTLMQNDVTTDRYKHYDTSTVQNTYRKKEKATLGINPNTVC